ncbi:MAG: LysR family transcriptional regulator [Alphaproteobacteria bacterium]|nr:LysR family transcriptional regulator [Alphaproteobacteria bacterium]
MNSFDWDDLRVFLAVYRRRSVRSAARSLAVSHSTASRRLENLETKLGAKLFHRSPEGFIPTTAGEMVLERADRIETETFGLERDVFGHDTRLSGPIRITVPPPVAQYLIMPHLADFGRLYPEIEIEMVSTYDFSDLARRDADIAIRFAREPESYLVGRRLPDAAEAVYATPEYVEQHSFEGDTPTARWIGWRDLEEFPKWVKKSDYPRCPTHWRLPDMLLQLEAAKAGLGMAIVSCFVGDKEPSLTRVPPGGIYQSMPGWVLTHPDLRTTERVRACVRFLVDAINSHEALITGQLPLG